jgi:DNA (cytosine-5)-methyltransferase 1
VAWGDYGPAIARWERLTGIAAPFPFDDQGRHTPELVEWMMDLEPGHTDCGPSRAQRLRMLGNGVVIRQAVAGYSALGVAQ